MATAQKQRTTLSTTIFPNKIATEQQSLILVKRLLAIAVSCITYLRGIFPECAYGTRYLDDLCVKILREDKNCPGSTQLVKWMLGCYDALQKKYLRLIMLAVYTDQENPQTVTECYQFKFKYTDKGPSMDFTSKNQGNNSNITCGDTKKASILLIRKIYVLMQNLGPLPDDVCLTMKLFYYDEVTPADYQPPGFKEGDCEEVKFAGEPTYLNVGEVPTPFHRLKVKVTTEKERMERVDKAILTQNNSLNSPNACHPGEGEGREMDEDFIPEDKMRPQKTTRESLTAGEPNLVCEENEDGNIKPAGEASNVSINNSQVSQLINKTSELEVAEGKTRSGKRFHGNTAGAESSRKQLAAAARAQKRCSSESVKPISHFDFDSSQESGRKRRKFSEPEY
ncbi:HORMA domain-containing protein 1 isoform X1 [Sceloporus undulatus]|uniref:HORMA domain-containing protein 1 isoform X1 n=1 Tax=Sceloporus undulatus TaxID=8520 RepID=UPI001C4D6534|nr:HORMA domain-containing protein 1 isoform X1 [Sceloporus undulatus]XP_042297080.1 HORMA domain-containing protein 1 isoform X1 [Sceloporus undulatus]XP_042297081.1 HORMA domain-containing protein 1 isoform X1 [Sceloporus undulatus]XP_042297082.1 HORMA domain-containing protein 1 isoform X1 [Sceloporus undulatus]